jgi:Protein of unknown function (DUF3618)
MASTNRAGESVDALRNDIVEARDDLGDTVQALAGKADLSARAKRAARMAASQAGEVSESVRRRPGRWGVGAAAAAVLAAVAAVGALKWRRNQKTPKGRAKRAWRSVSDRFTSVTDRFSR